MLAGTSLLLPGNSAWQNLKKKYALEFADFSQWSSLLFQPHSSQLDVGTMVLLFFLQDVLSEEHCAALDRASAPPEQMDDLLRPLLVGIEHALSTQTSRTLIVAWSNASQFSAIESARRQPVWERIAARWEALLRELQRRSANLFLLPMDSFFAVVGRENCFDSRNYYAARCRLSSRGLAVLAGQIEELLLRLEHPAKKVLALDCDNTLWGGVIGEDGLAGIRLGEDGIGTAYADFQKVVQRLTRAGVLLVLLSKNNESDVWQMFEQHPSMALKREDIIAARINWNDKSANLVELAKELDLGLDSFVVWDDNPLEREHLRSGLPQVAVPEIPGEVWQWPGWLESSPLFARFETTDEDLRRGEMYKGRARFQSESAGFTTETDFLKSIKLEPTALTITEATLTRAAQLTAKTNQFNLRTCRYSGSELRTLVAEPGTIAFLSHLKDRFGDHGNVGLAIARPLAGARVALLDTFLLSCRVLGRHLEAWMLAECVRQLRRSPAEILLAEFIASERNQVAAGFLAEHGLIAAAYWDSEMQTAVQPFAKALTGELFAARLSQIAIPYLDIYSA
jgi:FkbH-like protein